MFLHFLHHFQGIEYMEAYIHAHIFVTVSFNFLRSSLGTICLTLFFILFFFVFLLVRILLILGRQAILVVVLSAENYS